MQIEKKRNSTSVFNMLAEITESKQIPFTTTFEVTYKCNLFCSHCYRVKENRKELGLEKILDALDELAEIGGLNLTLTGGEVLLRSDFIPIVAHARGKAFNVTVFTNGTLLDKSIARFFKEIAVNKVGISVYGATQETHERITGVNGSFKETMRAFQILKDEGVRTELKGVLMKGNIYEFRELYGLAVEIGAKPSFDPIVTPKTDGMRGPLEFRIDDEMLMTFYRDNGDLLGLNGMMSEEWSGDTRVLRCNAGINILSINPYGDLLPCLQLPVPIGNLREGSLKELWEGSTALNELRGLQDAEIETCKNCGIKRYCFRCPGIAYLEDGDIKAPSSTACELAGIFSTLY